MISILENTKKNYSYAVNKTPQGIIDALRSGNTWIVEGDLIDSLIFNINETARPFNTASMGQNLFIDKGKDIQIKIMVRDPQGNNPNNQYSTTKNPVLNHVDIIKGKIGKKILPSDPNYSKNTVSSTSVIARFDASGNITDASGIKSTAWTDKGNGWREMTLTISNVTDSTYFRLRGSNLGLSVTNETDGSGNPLSDSLTGTNTAAKAFEDLWFYSNPVFVYSQPSASTFQLIFTSDAHYGIKRAGFQGGTNVDAAVVNRAMIKKFNEIPSSVFPADGGLKASRNVGPIDYVVMTGDIANRQETSIQSASISWGQFKNQYIDSIFLVNNKGSKSPLYLAPGNHDVSNAIGYYKTMSPLKDSAAMVNIYNLMMPSPLPAVPYNYANSKVNYSKNIAGIHFMFVNMWPDSANRVWMNNDLANVKPTTPVFIFTHDQPDIETKHLKNPNGTHNINSTDKFENMVDEWCKDGTTVSAPSTLEQRGFANFVRQHPNIKVYLHGNSNKNEYYTYSAPDNNIVLKIIRVDSPMKGDISSTDETKLSFQVITIDSITKSITVRECLWNPVKIANAPIQWGNTTTFSFQPSHLDSVLASIVDTNYTIPSWTKYKRALVSALAGPDSLITGAINMAKQLLIQKTMPYELSMTFNGSPATQMGFAWYTNKGISGETLQIVAGKTTDTTLFKTPSFTFNAISKVFTTNYNVKSNNLFPLAGFADNSLRSYTSNKALAKGLTANTTYSYRVGKNGAWSQINSFTTAKNTKEKFSFIYFTDPQANTDDMFNVSQNTTHAAMKMYPNTNFWLSCGDLVETSGNVNSEWEYEQFFSTQQDIWNIKPFVPVEGNHDKTINKNFTNHFNTKSVAFDSTMATTPGSVYSFVYGDALFIALSYEDYSVAGYLDSLSKWMKTQVAANSDLRWRIAFFHKTMYTGSGSHQSDADGKIVRDKLTPLFDSLKIDWALEGHDHIYEVMGPIKNKTLVPNSITNQTIVPRTIRDNVTGKLGGVFDVQGGTLYFLNNSAGKKKYEPRDSATMATAEGPLGITNYFGLFTGRFGQTGEPTFSYVTVSSDTISISTYTVNDTGKVTLFDAFKIVDKKKDTPVLTWNNPADITYGTALSSTQLNASANTPGTFNYAPASGTVLNAGSHQLLTVQFVPNSTNFKSMPDSAYINVLKALSVISWNNPADITYPALLSATQLNATANNPGSFVYSPTVGTKLNPGNGQKLKVYFTPSATNNYNNASDSVLINVLPGSGIESVTGIHSTIYPNPVQDNLFIKSNLKINHLVVTDAMGKTRIDFTGNIINTISMKNLENGIYFVTITLEDNSTENFRILKN